MNESDPRSNAHYLNSSENKAWKKHSGLYGIRVGLNVFFRPYFHYCSSSVHYCEDHFHSRLYPQFKYMTFTTVYFITSRVYLEPTSWPAPSWLVSSVGRVLHRYRRGHGSNPVQAWIFFRPYFHYCSSSVHYCEDHFHSSLICSSNI